MLPHPGLERINKILLFAILMSIVLYFGRGFFILISFAGLLAMLMTPVSDRLENHGISRVFSSVISVLIIVCLLYTSDAADEEDSVDLGGRRIIKKKKKRNDKT